MNIGILALQGAVIEHENHLKKLDCDVTLVKNVKDLENIQGIILPGGESTTMGKLLRNCNLLEPLKKKIFEGLPAWGTCAGMILLSKEISNNEVNHIGLMNIKVKRNAYGSQIDSFSSFATIPNISLEALPLIFIRAPYITKVSPSVEVLLEINGKIVAAKENNMLVTSFHPELTNSLEFHKYFLRMCTELTHP